MLRKIKLAAMPVAIAAATMAIAAPAQAGEGANSVGHGVKCYFFMGVQFCYKGV